MKKYLVLDDEEMVLSECNSIGEARKSAKAWAKMLGTAIVQNVLDEDFTYGNLRETY